jgi:hypothetical protein
MDWRTANGQLAFTPNRPVDRIASILLGKGACVNIVVALQARCNESMNRITIIECKGYGWRKKIIKKLLAIHGKPPYVKSLKLMEVRTEVLPTRKGRCDVSKYLPIRDYVECGST